jgi:hypothetical protein
MACEMRLSLDDFLDAVEVAVRRMRASNRRGLNHANVRQRSVITRLADEIRGAASELAVARWLGIEWSRSVNTFHCEADVGEDVDVRCTERSAGQLILRGTDHPYRQFVLVTGTAPNLLLRGHIRGEEAMLPRYAANPHDWGQAWFIPQWALEPIPPTGSVPACLRQAGAVLARR